MLEMQEGVSPISYLKIFFRRKELLLIPAFLGLVLGVCTGMVLPKKYRSSTIILVEEGKTDNPLFNRLAVSTTVQQRLTGIRESILGWHSLVELVKRLKLDRDIKTQYEYERLIEKLREDTRIRMRTGNIIELAYEGREPQITQRVVENITNIFIERNVQMQDQETADAIVFIEEQLRVYQGKIKSAEIAQLQDQLNTLLIDSTEMHPNVRRLREQIDAKKEELRKQNLEYTENVNLAVQSTTPIIHEIKRALDTIDAPNVAPETPTLRESVDPRKDIYKVMLIDKLENVMARDVKVNEEIYNMLLQRLETAKITQRLQLSKEGTKYTILDPPRVPHKPFKPNKVLVAMVGLVLGGMLGVVLVVAVEFLDKSFLDVEEAKNFLGIPLLGAISKITTEALVRHERERKRWLYSLTFIAGITMIALTVTLTSVIK